MVTDLNFITNSRGCILKALAVVFIVSTNQCLLCVSEMSAGPAVVMRVVASAYAVAEKAGAIVRKVLHSGELGIVEKVGPIYNTGTGLK